MDSGTIVFLFRDLGDPPQKMMRSVAWRAGDEAAGFRVHAQQERGRGGQDLI